MPFLSVTDKDGETRVFKFAGDSFTIGRDPSCDLSLPEEQIDAFQTVISRDDSRYAIRNIGKHPITYLNYLPAMEADLYQGDEITLGSLTMLFELETDEEKAGEAGRIVEIVPGEKMETTVGSTLPPEDSRLIPEKEGAISSDKGERALEALYRVGHIIHSLQDPDLLLQKLVDLLTEVTRASRACFLASGESGELYAKAVSGRGKAAGKDKILISRSIVTQVQKTHAGVLCTNAETDSRFQGATSISLGKIRSAICVPVEWQNTLFGLLYLDARGFTRDFTSFDEHDLRLVKAISTQAALALDHAYREKGLLRENISLKRERQLRFGMIAVSLGMRKIMEAVSRLAPTTSTVLIRGETGCGKEVVARAIHLNSQRRKKPLVTVNCAAFPETLLQSELFGHEKGSFTGAGNRRIGKFEQAAGGTIFLDEIAELDPRSQVVLLRILEEKHLQRLGGNQNIPVDVRVIAATNRDLDRAIENGDLREDLYYRLKVLEIFVPPLRERKEDIEPLITFYLNFFAREGLRSVTEIDPAALEELRNYRWPGNVRELKNTIERILVLGSSPRITLEDIQFVSGDLCPPATPTGSISSIQDMEKERIKAVLIQAAGNKKRAAELLGINRATLYRKLKAYGISESDR